MCAICGTLTRKRLCSCNSSSNRDGYPYESLSSLPDILSWHRDILIRKYCWKLKWRKSNNCARKCKRHRCLKFVWRCWKRITQPGGTLWWTAWSWAHTHMQPNTRVGGEANISDSDDRCVVGHEDPPSCRCRWASVTGFFTSQRYEKPLSRVGTDYIFALESWLIYLMLSSDLVTDVLMTVCYIPSYDQTLQIFFFASISNRICYL